MTPADNLARAREWIERALEAEGVLYREGGKPYLSGKGEIIIGACAAAYAAIVQAKGKADAQHVRHYLLGQGFEVAARHTYDDLYAHAADMPEVPR